ncbi:MAG: divergent polysaccharide deacetylase family protein, partial [Candidatus Marinimicrobia bacterium]|nr:divergent polysaccharide deacetylase family protein [Candidatus Neomarinimicrobiota bacterium]
VLKRQQDHLDKLEDEIAFDTEKIEDEPPIEVEKVRPEPLPPLRGIIGLIIDDFGYRNDDVSKGFLDIPAKLTFAVIPGHEHSRSFSKNAVSAGYEVIVHMPMENIGKTFGEEEFVLMNYFQDNELVRRVKEALDHIPEANGLNNHQGSRATETPRLMRILAGVLKDENKFFIDSRTTINTLAEETMRQFDVPTNRRNIFLDNELDEEKIYAQLIQLTDVAERKGIAIGIGHVKPQTLAVLKKHIPELQQKGFKFEFVSKLVN